LRIQKESEWEGWELFSFFVKKKEKKETVLLASEPGMTGEGRVDLNRHSLSFPY